MVFKQEYNFINVFWQETTSLNTPSNTEDMYILCINIKLFHIISYGELLYCDIKRTYLAIYIYIVYITHH